MYNYEFNPFKNANVGDIVKFGNYPQTEDKKNQPIEWLVLSREENKMLLISKYGLEVRVFDPSSNVWSSSKIRQWLNDEFYNEAFNDQEKKFINPSNLSDVGTSDNIFFLSREEVGKYFVNFVNNEVICKPTEYAKANGAYVNSDNGHSLWWLRSPVLNCVSIVDCSGSIYYGKVCGPDCLSRPALWINI